MPLAVVFVVTVVAPSAMLVLIGLPVYESVSGTLAVILSTMREHGFLAGFEIAIPFLGAAATSILVRARYSIAMGRDANAPRHL